MLQKREWKAIAKALRVFDYHIDRELLDELKAFYFTGHCSNSGIEASIMHLSALKRLMLSQDQSDDYYLTWIRQDDPRTRANYLTDFPKFCEAFYKTSNIEVCPGRTEKIAQMFVEGVDEEPEFGEGLGSGEFFEVARVWITSGGYHQSPMISVFKYVAKRYFNYLANEGWDRDGGWQVRFPEFVWRELDPIFHFIDPEGLPPNDSPYYAYASFAQNYICNEVGLLDPIKVLIGEQLGIDDITQFECLPLLPRPSYEIPQPLRAFNIKGLAPNKTSQKEQEVYLEVYDASDENWPYPPLRFITTTPQALEPLVSGIVAQLKKWGYLKRKPALKTADIGTLLSSEFIAPTPSKAQLTAQYYRFKPHPQLAMSDELALEFTLALSPEPKPIASGEYVENEGAYNLIIHQEQWNLMIYVNQPNRETIEDDSSLMKNVLQLIRDINSSQNLTFSPSVPADILDDWDYA